MSSLDAAAQRLIAQYISAVQARDVPALMRLYDPRARIFDAWGVWEYENAQAWQLPVEGWLGSSPSEVYKVSFDGVQVTGSEQFALITAVVTYASVSAQGEPLRSMDNRLTWAVRTSGHLLRIVHEHTSAPIGFEDQKALLQRARPRPA